MERSIYEQLEIPEENRYVPITKEEAEFIYSFLKGTRMSVTLEVGLAYGCSAAHIIAATKTKHYAIDPFQDAFNEIKLRLLLKF